jgi:hypothetical protein
LETYTSQAWRRIRLRLGDVYVSGIGDVYVLGIGDVYVSGIGDVYVLGLKTYTLQAWRGDLFNIEALADEAPTMITIKI